MNKFLKDFEASFIVKFLLLMAVFYYFHIIYWGITLPGGMYSPFIQEHLNYIDWLTNSILHTCNALVNLTGTASHLEGPNRIVSSGGSTVIISFECLGLGVCSFWTAFIIPHSGSWQRKLYWILLGIFSIWVINCLRISFLLISLEMNWKWLRYIDHHDMFNVVAYIFIFVLIYLYGKANKQELLKTTAVGL